VSQKTILTFFSFNLIKHSLTFKNFLHIDYKETGQSKAGLYSHRTWIVFLYYLAKHVTQNCIFSFKCHDNTLLKHLKTLSIKCLLTASFSCRKCPHQMFKMFSLCVNTRLQMLSPLTDGSADNALLQTTPHVKQSLPEVIDIVDMCLIDMLLYALWLPKSCSQ